MLAILILQFFLSGFFFFPLQVRHTDFCFTYHILPHQRKKPKQLIFCVWALRQYNHRVKATTSNMLRSFTPVFKQRLDWIIKGILWHGFLFIAETQLGDPTSLFQLCDHTAHGDIKEWLLPYSLTCLLCRWGKFYLHHSQKLVSELEHLLWYKTASAGDAEAFQVYPLSLKTITITFCLNLSSLNI